MRHFTPILTVLAFALALAAHDAPARAQATDGQFMSDTVMVEIDRARVLRLDDPAATVILGNPAIADALVHDSQMLVVTGKSYGATNLIVLDGDGRTVGEITLHVRAADDGIVTVQRGQSRSSLSCAPQCAPALMVGDTPENYDALSAQIQSHIGMSQAQAGR